MQMLSMMEAQRSGPMPALLCVARIDGPCVLSGKSGVNLAFMVALASLTLLRRLGGAFWEAFSRLPSSSAAAGLKTWDVGCGQGEEALEGIYIEKLENTGGPLTSHSARPCSKCTTKTCQYRERRTGSSHVSAKNYVNPPHHCEDRGLCFNNDLYTNKISKASIVLPRPSLLPKQVTQRPRANLSVPTAATGSKLKN
jgi:hypothetical protein